MTREYSGKDVQVSALGRPIAVTEIKYKASQEKKNKHVLGRKVPYAKIVGRKEYEGEMVLPQSELEALQRSLPAGKDPLDIAPFDVVVIYIDEVSNVIVTDILKDCVFTELEKGMKQDDDSMDVSMPLSIGKIIYNAA